MRSARSFFKSGAVADSIVLPSYDIATASNNGEASYLYIGVDSSSSGYAEVGFGTTKSQSTAAGWYPLFHAKGTHTLVTGYNSNSGNGYYYDTGKPQAPGSSIASFKVYYKYDESTLKIRYLLGTTEIYVVSFTGVSSTSKAVKRVTSIGMGATATNKTPFTVPWTSYAYWNNFRFLTNNGTATKYTNQITGLENQSWDHGGKIDYTNNGSTTARVESYKIYK